MKTITPASATETRVISITDEVLSPLLMTVHNVGNAMQINTDEDKSCPAKCLYCSNDLKPSIKCRGKKEIRRVLDRNEGKVIKIANICNPDAIFFQEKIEVGLDIPARNRAIRMIKSIHSDVLSFITSKFTKSVWKYFDGLVNTCILTSLTNPFHISELEPNVPSYKQRLGAIYDAYYRANTLLFGIRAIIMQEREIDIIYQDVKRLIDLGIVKPEHCFIGCLRSGKEKSSNALDSAVGHVLDMSEYAPAPQQGKTLRKDILVKVIEKFGPLGVNFDRFPKNYRVGYSDTANFNDYIPRDCYILPGVQCIQFACRDDHLVCSGVRKDGTLCPRLGDCTPSEYWEGHETWMTVYEKSRYAWGLKKGRNNTDPNPKPNPNPNSNTLRVFELMFNSNWSKKKGFTTNELRMKDHPTINLEWKEVIQ